MNDFFEEYSWTCLSTIGGVIGMRIIFSHFFVINSSFSMFLETVLERLML